MYADLELKWVGIVDRNEIRADAAAGGNMQKCMLATSTSRCAARCCWVPAASQMQQLTQYNKAGVDAARLRQRGAAQAATEPDPSREWMRVSKLSVLSAAAVVRPTT